jgi:hypothetical protein
LRGWCLRVVSAKDWWGTDGRSPRHYAEALVIMKGDGERQKRFMETHVPEHIRDHVRSLYKSAVALGGKD